MFFQHLSAIVTVLEGRVLKPGTAGSHILTAVDKTRNMEHPGTSNNYDYYEKNT